MSSQPHIDNSGQEVDPLSKARLCSNRLRLQFAPSPLLVLAKYHIPTSSKVNQENKA
jgi:hypothetical protein